MGIEDEKIDQIIEAHTETVDALKEQRDKYKADADKLPGVQQELDDLKDAAEKNADDPYKAKYEKEHEDFENYKADVTARETKAKKVAAYRQLLKNAKIDEKRLDTILKVSTVDDIELDDKGAVKDADKITENIKSEWADFIVTEETRNNHKDTPPGGEGGGAGGNGGGTKSRAAQIAAQYQQSLYGSTKGAN